MDIGLEDPRDKMLELSHRKLRGGLSLPFIHLVGISIVERGIAARELEDEYT